MSSEPITAVVVTDIPNTAPLLVRGATIHDRAVALAIVDDDSYGLAAEILRAAATLDEQIVGAFAESKKKAHEAHKAICALEETLRTVPRAAMAAVKEKGRAYLAEQERVRLEREAAIQVELRRQEEEQRLAAAIAAEAAGDARAAAEILDETMPLPAVELPKPQAAGVGARVTYSWRVTDRTKIRPEYLAVDEKKINAAVRSHGRDAATVVGGIEVIRGLDMVRR